MGLPQAREEDTLAPVYEDNTACIEWGNHVIGGRERAKHVVIHNHFAREVIQNHHIRHFRVPTGEQLTDIFTEAIPFPQFERCLMGLIGGDMKPTGP